MKSGFLGAFDGEEIQLDACDGYKGSHHVFEKRSVDAINAALASGRPLLVRGEPGTGKSQLARAAAQKLGRVFVSKVVDAKTDARDLFWTFDAVARLAKAQVLGALGIKDAKGAEDALDELLFVRPGPLWWGFSFEDAKTQAMSVGAPTPHEPKDFDPSSGRVVVLLDEIDKADGTVPNGLLEALGNGAIAKPRGALISSGEKVDGPLVIVTTNEERTLPDAFIRRCLVLNLRLPKETKALEAWLIARGRVHFRKGGKKSLSDETLQAAASLLVIDRQAYVQKQLSPPGQAEYLDLLRAIETLATSQDHQIALLEDLAEFVFKKHGA